MLWTLEKFFNRHFVYGANQSLDYNRIMGQWHVVYPDGIHSQRMCYDTAVGYTNIFGGQIKHISELE